MKISPDITPKLAPSIDERAVAVLGGSVTTLISPEATWEVYHRPFKAKMFAVYILELPKQVTSWN